MLELYINSFSEPQKNLRASGLDEARNFLQEVEVGVNYRSSLTKSVSLKEKRALEFLTVNYNSYDMNLALIICQLHNFRVRPAECFSTFFLKIICNLKILF